MAVEKAMPFIQDSSVLSSARTYLFLVKMNSSEDVLQTEGGLTLDAKVSDKAPSEGLPGQCA